MDVAEIALQLYRYDYYVLIYTHLQELMKLMKSAGSHGSGSLLLFTMKKDISAIS
jgi:hypothetical protein